MRASCVRLTHALLSSIFPCCLARDGRGELAASTRERPGKPPSPFCARWKLGCRRRNRTPFRSGKVPFTPFQPDWKGRLKYNGFFDPHSSSNLPHNHHTGPYKHANTIHYFHRPLHLNCSQHCNMYEQVRFVSSPKMMFAITFVNSLTPASPASPSPPSPLFATGHAT